MSERGRTRPDVDGLAQIASSGIEQREARTLWGESTAQDVRFALRTLKKSLGFTATAILTLALGIGANTAIFQLVDAVRLRNLPVADPRTLASVRINGGTGGFGITYGDNETALSYPLWQEIRRYQQAFSRVFAWADSSSGSLGEGAQKRRAHGLWVSGEAFATLGVPALRGRMINDEDDKPGCGSPGAIISYGLWQSEFGGQDSAIGSALVINGRRTAVIGIAPRAFFGLEVGKKFDYALPFCSMGAYFPGAEGADSLSRRELFMVRVVGRLKPGWSLQRASAQLESMSAAAMEATIPSGYSTTALDTYRKFRLGAYPGGSGISALRRAYDTSLSLLLGITALVLLIACANLANLMLARASTREREMAVRLALGASRWRLIRQLLSEGFVLAMGGALLGVGLANVFSRGLIRFLNTETGAVQLDLSMSWHVLVFTSFTAVLTCVVFGLAPAFRSSRADPGVVLKTGARGMTSGRERFSFQRFLVVSQIAVSVVLLVGALLFVRSFRNLMTVDPGFREEGVLIANVDFRRLNLSQERWPTFIRDLLAQVRTLPEIESAATSTHIPLWGGNWTLRVQLNGSDGLSMFTWVSPGYFETMQIPVLAGRDFNDRDTRSSPHVAIVNQTFVQKYLGGANPLGKTVRTLSEPRYPQAEYEIVGLTKDTKYGELREPTPPVMFAPAEQYPDVAPWAMIVTRFGAQPSAAISAFREKISEINPAITMDFRIFQTEIENRLTRERLMALLSGFFGMVAALLAMIGLYGVVSYIVALRKNEIGIRMALGASRENVVLGVLRQTLYLVIVGVVLGIGLALAATRGAGSLLFGLAPHDPLTMVIAAGFLVVIALIASYVPARRASSVDPMNALRYE
jgi:putative ABC transport system permease protein